MIMRCEIWFNRTCNVTYPNKEIVMTTKNVDAKMRRVLKTIEKKLGVSIKDYGDDCTEQQIMASAIWQGIQLGKLWGEARTKAGAK